MNIREKIEQENILREEALSEVKKNAESAINEININHATQVGRLRQEEVASAVIYPKGAFLISTDKYHNGNILLVLEDVVGDKNFDSILIYEDGSISQRLGELIGKERLATMEEVDAAFTKWEERGSKEFKLVEAVLNMVQKHVGVELEADKEPKPLFKKGDVVVDSLLGVGCLLHHDVYDLESKVFGDSFSYNQEDGLRRMNLNKEYGIDSDDKLADEETSQKAVSMSFFKRCTVRG